MEEAGALNTLDKIQENVFENIVWKMSAILSRPQCANVTWQRRQSNGS